MKTEHFVQYRGDEKPYGDMQNIGRLQAGGWLGIGVPQILLDKSKINRPCLIQEQGEGRK